MPVYKGTIALNRQKCYISTCMIYYLTIIYNLQSFTFILWSINYFQRAVSFIIKGGFYTSAGKSGLFFGNELQRIY